MRLSIGEDAAGGALQGKRQWERLFSGIALVGPVG